MTEMLLLALANLGRWLRLMPSRDVSKAWMVDNDRRDWTAGVDQVSIRWPIRKVVNEASRFQAAKLRRRA